MHVGSSVAVSQTSVYVTGGSPPPIGAFFGSTTVAWGTSTQVFGET